MHRIKVRLKADGTAECFPIETVAHPGDELVWEGLQHTGRFEGKIPANQKQRNFRAEDLPQLTPGPGTPFSPVSWKVGAPPNNTAIIKIDANAPAGSYKYSVVVGDHTIDPIIVIEMEP